MRVHDQPDHLRVLDIEHTAFDQEVGHGRVEIRVVDDVVDMGEYIVVHPAGGHRKEVRKRGAGFGGCSAHQRTSA